jgi:GNAT superfamily N-acetyltransferase
MDPATAGAVAALEHIPFYRAISDSRESLAWYLDYSIHEGSQLGRSVHLTDPTRGIAVWVLPQPAAVLARAAERKLAFLKATFEPQGFTNYCRIVEFMSAQAVSLVDEATWYLSILAVDPAAQSQGFGGKLLAPTLAEADRASARCWLETFNFRSIPFYERHGFVRAAQFSEPTTGADYVVMRRE